MKKFAVGFIAATAAIVGPANAAFIDFVGEAAGNERGVADGAVIDFGGINIGFFAPGEESSFAYFDDLDAGRPAGLGVCETLVAGPGSHCLDSGDDNIGEGESVFLSFDEPTNLSNFSFTDANHVDLNLNDFNTLIINDAQYTFAQAVGLVFEGITSIKFEWGGSAPADFYVNSLVADVPLPAAAPLLIAGLAGLGFASRRKKEKRA